MFLKQDPGSRSELAPAAPSTDGSPLGYRNSAGGKSFAIAAVMTLALAIVPAVLWPGASSWHWDEPFLVGQAFHYNQHHQLAERGLGGSFGVPYGPVPTQCYQLMLLFTHDLRVMIVCRALLCSSLLAGSLIWLGRSLRLTPWFSAAIVLAPFLVWTERDLWDATFAMPIGILAVAAYASFLRGGSRISLAIAAGAGTLGPFIHMMGLPLFFALAGHALLCHRRALLRNWMVYVSLGLVIALNHGYFLVFLLYLAPNFLRMFRDGYGARAHGMLLESLTGPFLGGRILTGENWVVPRSGLPGPPGCVPIAISVSFILIGLIWLGIYLCIGHMIWLRRERRSGRVHDVPPSSDARRVNAARASMISIALTALLLQTLLAISLRVPPEPQYSFGTFPIHVLFAWFGVEALRRIWLSHLATAAYGLAVGYLTIGGAWSIHRNGWPRGLMSPSVNDQIDVARQLNKYSDKVVWTDVAIYQRFPRALRTLRLLIPPDPGAAQNASPHGLLIRYQPAGGPDTHRIELIELAPPAVLDVHIFSLSVSRLSLSPADATPMDVTPADRLY